MEGFASAKISIKRFYPKNGTFAEIFDPFGYIQKNAIGLFHLLIVPFFK